MYSVNCSCGNLFTVSFWYTRSVKPANFVLELYLISDVNDFGVNDFVAMFLNIEDDDANICFMFVCLLLLSFFLFGTNYYYY